MSTSGFRALLKKDTIFFTQMVEHIYMVPVVPHYNEFVLETKDVLKHSGIELCTHQGEAIHQTRSKKVPQNMAFIRRGIVSYVGEDWKENFYIKEKCLSYEFAYPNMVLYSMSTDV